VKKLLSIPFVMLLLISGMHVSIATHFCGGKIADTKISITGRLASCGMEVNKQVTAGQVFTSRCCEDEVKIYATDEEYTPPVCHLNSLFQLILDNDFVIPCADMAVYSSTSITYYAPPGSFSPYSVSLPKICSFLI